MSSSQLSNPKAVWFLGAPVSKAIVITAVVTYIVAEMNKLHQALIFGAYRTSLYAEMILFRSLTLTIFISFYSTNRYDKNI
jgi:hypothetical protein